MDESNKKSDKQSLRPAGSFKSTLSGRSTPRNSPTFRRLHSSRTPRRESRSSISGVQWFRSNRLLFFLILITLWTYIVFYVQSTWAHGDNGHEFLAFGRKRRNAKIVAERNQRHDFMATNNLFSVNDGTINNRVEGDRKMDVVLAKKGNDVSSHRSMSSKKRRKRSARRLRGNGHVKSMPTMEVDSPNVGEQDKEIPKKNTSYGLLVGPFGLTEDRILEWSPEKRSGTCDRKGDFARLVWSRRFILIFHELSMTGAPISMMELATELLSCGATVSAVVLSKKGGLMPELARRRIKLLEDRADLSFKTAMKSDLVIAGSAVCASWIEQYIDHFPAGASQIAWWIMENRREYFERSKGVLDRVKMLIFLSESQSKQWLNWCEEENIKLRSHPALVPLSVNDELAFVAGISCTLNTPSFSTQKMFEKRQLLRDSVRKEMGLTDKEVLVMSLSSINPGKGQLLLLESASTLLEDKSLDDDSKIKSSADVGLSKLARRHHLRSLFQMLKDDGASSMELTISKNQSLVRSRNVLSDSGSKEERSLKLLIGSVGSKSNKVDYVKGLLSFIRQHSNFSTSVLWTPATTRVASLYSAADVYVINSQGLGETFGRVTIEAMAFGLPVLGTDAGGTKEIVEHNITGLLHPVGRPGNRVLAQNLQFLLKNRTAREKMGMEGRKKVEKMYLKRLMYKRFVEVLVKCMRPK